MVFPRAPRSIYGRNVPSATSLNSVRIQRLLNFDLHLLKASQITEMSIDGFSVHGVQRSVMSQRPLKHPLRVGVDATGSPSTSQLEIVLSDGLGEGDSRIVSRPQSHVPAPCREERGTGQRRLRAKLGSGFPEPDRRPRTPLCAASAQACARSIARLGERASS